MASEDLQDTLKARYTDALRTKLPPEQNQALVGKQEADLTPYDRIMRAAIQTSEEARDQYLQGGKKPVPLQGLLNQASKNPELFKEIGQPAQNKAFSPELQAAAKKLGGTWLNAMKPTQKGQDQQKAAQKGVQIGGHRGQENGPQR
jgi:hypothetical protein